MDLGNILIEEEGSPANEQDGAGDEYTSYDKGNCDGDWTIKRPSLKERLDVEKEIDPFWS